MTASRLLHLLLLLQTRERVSTTDLAADLEVSRRTILRDVQALSEAGVPVYAEWGRYGGVTLLPTSRLNASYLDPAELEALSLTGSDEDMLRRRIRLGYRRSGEEWVRDVRVDPYGLVVKAGRWCLVGDVEGRARLFAVSRVEDAELLEDAAALRSGQTLASIWHTLREATEDPGDLTVSIRLRANRSDLAERIVGTRLVEVSPAVHGWVRAQVRCRELEGIRQLLPFGDHLEVLAPAQARARLHELALETARRHEGAPDDRER